MAICPESKPKQQWTPRTGTLSYREVVSGDTCEGCRAVGKWRRRWLAPALYGGAATELCGW